MDRNDLRTDTEKHIRHLSKKIEAAIKAIDSHATIINAMGVDMGEIKNKIIYLMETQEDKKKTG